MRKGTPTFDKKILYQRYGRWLWAMRQVPFHGARWLSGVVLPAHERFWLFNYFADYKENNIVASRGTSKSFTHCSLAAPLKATLFKNLGILTLSASGFRGGKELFKDSDRLFHGQLKSQKLQGDFLKASLTSGKVIKRDPSIWTVELKSHSRHSTIPTNNAESMRGLRANIINVDERNYFDGEIIHKVARPMLNVGQDFLRTASGGDKNQIFQISTIDLTVRDWYPEIQEAEKQTRNQYDAMKALKQGDHKEYQRLMEDDQGSLKASSFSYSRVDYTDLLIPQYIDANDGKRYRVHYPLRPGLKESDILKWDERDKMSYFYSYPVDKAGLEEPLHAGIVDEEIWMAEQRNCFIQSAGNVFEWDLIQKVAERPIYDSGKIPGYEQMEDEFYAPVLWDCGDPCVLGIDVARESDETSFVIIRLGEMADGKFDPTLTSFDSQGRVRLGKTSWNNIIWAESYKNLEYSDAADKIREYLERYNIIYTLDVGGIGMDARGGGGAVRDQLGNPKPPLINGKPDPDWDQKKVMKLYDPEDDKGFGHYSAFEGSDQTYWGGLRLLSTTNTDNMEWTYGARAMMQQKKLYIAYWQPPSRWAFERGLTNLHGQPDTGSAEFQKLHVGYEGIRRLKSQLLRIQVKRSEAGVIRFVMPGDREKEEGKKDLYVAMTYGVHMGREHLVRLTKDEDDAPPTAVPIAVQIGSGGMRYGGGGDVRRWRGIV